MNDEKSPSRHLTTARGATEPPAPQRASRALDSPSQFLTAGHDPTELLTPQRAAKVLCLSPRTLEGMRSSGHGPKFAKLGRGRSGRIVYRRGDLDAWVASRIRTSTQD